MYRLLCCLLATPTTSIVQGATFFKVCNAYVIQGARGCSAKQGKARQLYKRQGGRASFSCLGGRAALPPTPPLSLCLAAAAQTCFANPVCQDSRDPLQEHSMSCICKQILLPSMTNIQESFFTSSLPFFLPLLFSAQQWCSHKPVLPTVGASQDPFKRPSHANMQINGFLRNA